MDANTKKYQLVKYKYGWKGRYTAFCLTPMLKQPRTVERFGKKLEFTNMGVKSRYSRHFQSPTSAMAWADTNHVEIIAPSWQCIPGTAIW